MPPTNGDGPDRPRVPLSVPDRIDVCRGLFAFLVVIAHSIEVTFSMLPQDRDRLGPLGHLVVLAAGTGVYWVMGFFVISGYCIQLSVDRLCDRGAFPLGNYLIARLTRLLPLYYLALLFTVAVEWGVGPARPANWPNGLDTRTLACQVLLVQNLTQTYGSFASSWSITNEAFYYVLYGVLVAWALRSGRRPIATGLAACLGVGGLAYLAYKLVVREPALAATALLFGLGIHWFLGAMIAAHRDALARDPRAQRLARAWPMVLAAAVAVRCLDRKGIEVVMIVSGLAFALMMIRFLGADRRGGRAEDVAGRRPRPFIAGLGLASYPTYLFHGPILMVVGSLLIRFDLVIDWRLTCAILAGSGIAAGILGGYLLEAPIMSWRAAMLRRLAGSGGPGRLDRVSQIPIPAAR